MEEKNVFYGKSVEEATEAGLAALGLSADQAEITVLDEGTKKLFGGTKAKVKVGKKLSDGARAVQFIDGLMEIIGLNVVAEIVSDGEKIEINLTSTESSRIIGRHGDVLDAVQTLAGAVANIGREDYKKVVVDCESYRANREKTLTELAKKLEKKAVERGRRVSLEPMNPYERRIIHSALADSEQVKTISSGKEPQRFVIIVPNNEKPYEKRDFKRGGRDFDRGERRFDKGRGRDRGERGNGRRDGRGGSSGGGARKGKKEIHFGTFLGNSGDND